MSSAKSYIKQIDTNQSICDETLKRQKNGIDNFNAWVFGSPIIEVLLIHHLVEIKHGKEWKIATVINYNVQLDKHFILYDNGIYDLVHLQRDCVGSEMASNRLSRKIRKTLQHMGRFSAGENIG